MTEIDYGSFTIKADDPVPMFEPPIEMEEISPITDGAPTTDEPPKRRRGRPPGSKNKPKDGSVTLVSTRNAKEVSVRLQKMMLGATGIAGAARPHFAMTESEANDIAEPLTTYLLRQEQYSANVREFLDRYDLFAASIAVMTYLVRVWVDDQTYREQNAAKKRRINAQRSEPTPRNAEVSPNQSTNGRSESTDDVKYFTPNGGYSGVSTGIAPGQL